MASLDEKLKEFVLNAKDIDFVQEQPKSRVDFSVTKMPKKFWGVNFETHPNKITERVKKFCLKEGGGILVIIGGVGTAKTETACCCFNERIINGLRPGEYVNVKYTLCPAYRSTRLSNSDITEIQFFERLYNLPFLVLDEAGAGDDEEIERRVVDHILSAAYDNGSKVLITTNMTMQEYCDFMGRRITDRFKEIAEVCALDGQSWRGRNE